MKPTWPALIALLFALPLSSPAQQGGPVKVQPPQFGSLSAPNGRYVFGQVSEYARHQYMLDTQTGRLWQAVRMPAKAGEKEGQLVLEPVPYILEGDRLILYPTEPRATPPAK